MIISPSLLISHHLFCNSVLFIQISCILFFSLFSHSIQHLFVYFFNWSFQEIFSPIFWSNVQHEHRMDALFLLCDSPSCLNSIGRREDETCYTSYNSGSCYQSNSWQNEPLGESNQGIGTLYSHSFSDSLSLISSVRCSFSFRILSLLSSITSLFR